MNRAIDHILAALEEGLSEKLVYHCLDHTLQVMESARSIASAEGVEAKDFELLNTAAAFHDSGFLRTYKNHEEVGCEIAAEVLPEYGFSPDDVRAVQSMIMATRIPQSPKSALERILCDADLEYLGGDRYDEISNGLWEELNLNGASLNKRDWLDVQIRFLDAHHYWTKTAIEGLEGNKQKVLRRLREEGKSLG